MYIIAIGWLYVTILVAATEPTVFAAVVSFVFYGALPCALLLWLGGTRARRQRRRLLADQQANQSDRPDPEADQ